MALTDILKRIESDVDSETSCVVDEARRKAEWLVSQARAEAEQSRDEILAEAKMQAERERDTTLANARLQARDRAVAARHELAERVLRRAEEALGEIGDDEYAALLARRVVAVSRGGEEVRFAEADKARLSGRLQKAVKAAAAEAGVTVDITYSDAPADVARGALVSGDRTTVKVSPAAIVHDQRDYLLELAATVLFGEEDA